MIRKNIFLVVAITILWSFNMPEAGHLENARSKEPFNTPSCLFFTEFLTAPLTSVHTLFLNFRQNETAQPQKSRWMLSGREIAQASGGKTNYNTSRGNRV